MGTWDSLSKVTAYRKGDAYAYVQQQIYSDKCTTTEFIQKTTYTAKTTHGKLQERLNKMGVGRRGWGQLGTKPSLPGMSMRRLRLSHLELKLVYYLRVRGIPGFIIGPRQLSEWELDG